MHATLELPAATVRASAGVAAQLARRMPAEAAVGWVHAGALTRHAVTMGLVDDHGSVPATLDALARAHPALAGLADPAVTHARSVPTPDLDAVRQLWAAHPLPDRRGDGQLLGDLYQALSAEARKGRALCQTPGFVAELLWDLAADDALAEFGPALRMIDPACGTGHLLVETAISLSARDRRLGGDRFERALDAVHGVDLDPYAAQLARYRLLLLACRHGGRRWTAARAPRDLPIHVAAADSLLAEDEPLLQRGRYHLVLGNPPYITVKDAAANAAIRARYRQVCHGRYSLALPFFQLMTELLVPGGYCAQLTANSWMKREFGRPFVENYLRRLDLTWVIDTSGAYIPGHGTPTVILVHRNRPPSGSTVATVLGKRGEPRVPADPARGLVWSAIRDAVDRRLSARHFAAGAAAWMAEHTPPGVPDHTAPPARRPAQPTLFDLIDGDHPRPHAAGHPRIPAVCHPDDAGELPAPAANS